MSSHTNNDDLMHDLQAVIKDAEVLMKSSALPNGEDFRSAKERIETTLKNAKDEIIRLEKLVVGKTKEAAQATDTYVKDNPWQAVGLGAAVGLVIGLLISRK
ncbi:DUF883 family protein [Solimicrobium silvestre]|uniref:DUF883 domain-containing protein n=1 Tax=Solimicrobium silvestre TaxID=2099400 RepID=A0A2S9GUZ1_9BURK|nr:DUF883 family protein [Solimicrobium silvestre]PRC91545.1 hypothetical protein S2091_3661 [Solimicrobium silvestre]